MKKILRGGVCAGMVLLSVLVYGVSVSVVTAAVGINAQIPFYGTLRDAGGALVTGTYDVVFRIYDAPTAGTVLWTGNHTGANGNAVLISDGVFQVMLGSGAGNEITLDFNDDRYYLGITIGSDAEMSPRERLGASGYAFNANLLDGLDASAFVRANPEVTIAATTTDSLVTVYQGGGGKILTLANSSNEVFTVLRDGRVGIGDTAPVSQLSVAGVVTAAGFTSVGGGDSTFDGRILVQGNDSVFDGSATIFGNLGLGGDLSVSAGSGILFGNGDGLKLYQDTTSEFGLAGVDNLFLVPGPNNTSGGGQINLLVPEGLGLYANAGFDGLGNREPALILRNDGNASISSQLFPDSVFSIDFTSGVEVTNGDFTIGGGNAYIAGGGDPLEPTLIVDGEGGLRIPSLAQDVQPAFLVSDTSGNIGATPSLILDSDGNVVVQNTNLSVTGSIQSGAGLSVLGDGISMITGSLKIGTGDPAAALDVDGTVLSTGLSVDGAMLASSLEVSGEVLSNGLNVNGDIISTGLEVNGDIFSTGLNVDGEILSTSLNVNGDIVSTGLQVNGDIFSTGLNVDGAVLATSLDVDGGIRSSSLSNVSGLIYELESDPDGNITLGPVSSSDERLKQNIQTLDNALETITALRGVRYEWKDTMHLGSQPEIGFIAQEVQTVLPEVVRTTGEYLSINTKNITAVIVEAVKELSRNVDEYFERTERLEDEVRALREEIELLKSGHTLPTSHIVSESETTDTAHNLEGEPAPETDVVDIEPQEEVTEEAPNVSEVDVLSTIETNITE